MIELNTLRDECLQDYRLTSLYLAFPNCTFKCCTEAGLPLSTCQNCWIAKEKRIQIDEHKIVERYLENPVTKAIVCGGLEPIDSWTDLTLLVQAFREKTDDDFVIYTGYYEHEIGEKIAWLKQYKNIIVKFGRFIPNAKSRYDDILGVTLASDNQYAVRIS